MMSIVLIQLKCYFKQEQQKNKVVKTSNVDTAPTPIKKANALKKKESSKYTSYIASKLLPGID